MVWYTVSSYKVVQSAEQLIKDYHATLAPVTVTLPAWMQDTEVQGNFNGKVVTPTSPIEIRSGEEVGYFGLYEYCDHALDNPVPKQDYRIHLECFSEKQPPAFFLKLLGASENPGQTFTLIDGSKSNGVIQTGNPFFKDVATQIKAVQDKLTGHAPTGGATASTTASATPQPTVSAAPQPIDMSTMFTQIQLNHDNDLKRSLDTLLTQYAFDRLIVKHPTEWYDTSDSTYLANIWKNGQKRFEFKKAKECRQGTYLDSAFQTQTIASYTTFVDYQKAVLDKLVWMQEIASAEAGTSGDDTAATPGSDSTDTASDGEAVSAAPLQLSQTHWHFFPLVVKSLKPFEFNLYNLRKVFDDKVPVSKNPMLQAMADELNAHMVFYKLDTPLRRCHFFAQVVQEVGTQLHLLEDGNYSVTALKSLFKNARNLRYPAPDNRLYADVHGYTEKRNGHFYKTDGTQVTASDREIIYNVIYSNRMDNGDYSSGDGFKYKGRGLIHITGRAHYYDFNAWHLQKQERWESDVIDAVSNPSLIEQMKYAVRSAGWFWTEVKDKGNTCVDLATTNTDKSVDDIVDIINKKTGSRILRKKHFHRIWNSGVLHD